MKALRLYIITLMLGMGGMGCQEDSVEVDGDSMPSPPGSLHSYELLGEFSQDALRLAIAFTDYKEHQSRIQHGIQVFRVSYNTHFKGASVRASALVCLPDTTNEHTPLLMGMHGTLTEHSKAPSAFNLSQQHINGFEFFAALGFITMIPDYLGFGDSRSLVHPYYHYASSGESNLDLLRATQELLATLALSYQESLFLIGYSQGGYVSLATARYWQEHADSTGVLLKAVAAGAGAYHIRGVMEKIIARETYASPAYLAYLIYSFQQTYGWDRPLSDFFREPYATRLPLLFDGEHSQGAINDQLSPHLSELFQADFLRDLRQGKESFFLAALEENSVHDWWPHVPVRLYHEQDDEVVPIADSEETAATLSANGAVDLAYVPYDEGHSHSSGIEPMLHRAVPWFLRLRDEE